MLELMIYGLYVLLTFGAVFLSWKLRFAMRHFVAKKLTGAPMPLRDLPSVSVCIPARNETHAMTQCLERVIASSYPKLEIIVLDDSSVDNTSTLIKAFASDGVRFIEGTPLEEGWLGKNHALQRLLDEASGSYILYIDVDTQIRPDTITRLVAYVEEEKISMVSVLPRRQDGWRLSVLLSPLRYFWELVLHRASAPAVASSAWMINRTKLRDELGGFLLYRDAVQPEAKLAAALTKQHLYRFIIGTPQLGVSYEKKWLSQIQTSIRLLFPIFGGSLAVGFLVSVGLLLLTLPAFVFVSGFVVGWGLIQLASFLLLGVYGALYSVYLNTVWQNGWWLGFVLWPVVVAQELVVMVLSIAAYLHHSVAWKGRPITLEK